MKELYNQWLSDFESVGMKPISDDTAARILAIVYVYGGSMELTYNTKLIQDVAYCQRRAHINGAETPDIEITEPMKRYIADIETVLARKEPVESESPLAIKHPDWVCELMKERYGINKMWI